MKFSSAGLIKVGQANAIVEDADSDYDMDEWIRPSVPGVELNNWTSEDVVQVMLAQE